MVKITSKKGKLNIKGSGKPSEVLVDAVIAVKGICDMVEGEYDSSLAKFFKKSIQSLIADNVSRESEKQDPDKNKETDFASELDSLVDRFLDSLFHGPGMD